MKNSPALIFSIILCFTAVRINYVLGNEETELQDFLNLHQQDSKFVSRKIFIGDEEQSIKGYFTKSDSNGLIDQWAITKENVFEISSLINTVMSCEYSEINYYHTKLVDNIFNRSILQTKIDRPEFEGDELSKINTYFEKFEIIIDLICKQLSPMILTLAGLEKSTKRFASSSYDILRILLSWYTFMTRTKSRYTAKISSDQINVKLLIPILDSIKIVNYQTRSRLEQYMTKHCHCLEGLMTFKMEVDKTIENMTDFVDYTYLKEIDKSLNLITYPRFVDENENKRFIFNSKYNCDKLIGLLSRQITNGTLSVMWHDKSISVNLLYTQYIVPSLHMRPVIRFEKMIFDTIIEIIIGYVWSTLKGIADGTINDEEKSKQRMCNELLLDKIEKYRRIFKVAGHPTYLLNNIMSIKIDLLYACSLMSLFDDNKKLITDFISKLDRSKVHDFAGNDLESFLSSLSEMVLCGMLHPTISNLFLERINHYSTSRHEYIRDYQFFYTDYRTRPRRKALCEKISELQSKTVSLDEQTKTCSTIIFNGDRSAPVDSNESCFERFITTYRRIIIDVGDIMSNCLEENDNIMSDLAMTLIYNESYIKSLNTSSHELRKSWDDNRIRHLTTFAYIVRLMFDEVHHVTCGDGLSKHFKSQLGYDESDDRTSCSKWSREINSVDDLKTEKSLALYFTNQKKFSDFVDAAQTLLDGFARITLKLHWNGTRSTLSEVHDDYKRNAFDIRDFYDYSNYVLKWMIMLTYSMVEHAIVSEIGINDNTLDVEQRTKLQSYVEEFLNIDKFSVADLIFQWHIGDEKRLIHDMVTLPDALGLPSSTIPSLPNGSNNSGHTNSLREEVYLIIKLYLNDLAKHF